MKIRNVSGTARAVDPKDGEPFDVSQRGTVEVPDELGLRMIEQVDVWRPADDDEVPSGSVAAVLTWVGSSKERASAALEVENDSDKPRASLVGSLTEIKES